MSILLIGEPQLSHHLQQSLNNHNLVSKLTSCLKHSAELLSNSIYKVVICTTPYDDLDQMEILEHLKKHSPKSHIIFLDENIGVSKAIDLAKKGLYTCLNRPFLIEELIHHVKKALLDKTPVSGKNSVKYVQGKSKGSLEMLKQIRLVGRTRFSVIIYGETGTGKESVAEQLAAEYGNSHFVAVDCGCLSRELAASELFGHEKGAFTGADSLKIGAFEKANNGTLFLDEIGNLGYEIQAYLLRSIQERKVRRVGSEKEIPVNVRIIVASNEDLAEKVRSGKFREDLYHRLNEFEIRIPPLRERMDDLKLLIDHFIDQSNAELGKHVEGIDHQAFTLLRSYQFPGNIRELKNIIRKACLLTSDHGLIKEYVLPEEIANGVLQIQPKTMYPSEDYSIKKNIRQVEMDNIQSVLEKVNFNKTKAAKILNIDRKTLYNKLKKVYN